MAKQNDKRTKQQPPATSGAKKKPSVEERQKQRAKQARRENLRRTFRRIGFFAIFFVLFLAMNAWLSRDTGVGPLGEQYDAVRQYPVACGAEAPDAPTELLSFEAPVDQELAPEATVTAMITTSCGDLVLQLDPEMSPEAVNSFVFLAREGFYDGTVIHRIRPEVLIGAGDPLATGEGGAGYRVADEPPSDQFQVDRGTVILTPGAGPDRGSSQFTIALTSDAPLNRSASVLGTIIEGDDVLDRIGAVPVGIVVSSDRSYPLEAVYVEKVEITVAE